jgi:uncharacterized protein DUF3310
MNMLKRFNGVPGLRWLYTRYRQYVTGGVFLKFQECPIDEVELYKKGANAMQVGGRNYKKLPIEPWDYIAANGLGFFEGNIVKYITRAAKTKNRNDLLKAQHYLAKLLEITPVPEGELKSSSSRETDQGDMRLPGEIRAIDTYDESRAEKH